MPFRRYLLLILVLFGAIGGYAQSPYNGMIIEEIEIPTDTALILQTEGGFSNLPRTWRMYICLNQPDWELQGIFGGDFSSGYYPMDLTPASSNFFQSSLCSNQGLRTHPPAIETASPTAKYDSWFTIGNNAPATVSQIFGQNELVNDFEGAQSGFLVNDPIGGVIYSLNVGEGLPDAYGRVLVGQFTLDGLFTGTLNFQFRRLQFTAIDTVIYDPPGPATNLTDSIGGIVIDNTPGVMDTVCSIQFLPIRLVDFNASAIGQQVQLNWETSSEENNDYFTVERSTDLISWKEITRLQGAGNSFTTRLYYTIDQSPELGVNYYRLRQTDFDGESETYGIRAVEFKGSPKISLYPNPSHTRVFLRGDLSAVNHYILYDAYGQQVFSKNLTESMREVNISDFAPGMYFLELHSSIGKLQTLRLNIQR